MRFAIAVLVLILCVLQYKLLFSNDGITTVKKMQAALEQKKQENVRLSERNASLAAEVKDLNNDFQAVEEHARTDLGMVRKDEEFYQIVEEKK